MADDKRISELPLATTPLAGTEELEIVQGGVNKRVASSNIGGGGSVTSVTGENNAVDNTDTANPIVRNGVRVITGASASVIADNNGLVIFNSASPFDFTLDQLAANTKISFINYGAGDVTFIQGSGVTLTGTNLLPGASDPVFPSCLVIYDALTTPRVVAGGSPISILAREEISINTGTLTLDFIERELRNFELDAAASSGFTIVLDNDTNATSFDLVLLITGTVAVTMPSDFRMMETEEYGGRWNTSTRVLTLTGTTGSIFRVVGTLYDAVWLVEASVPYV